MHTQFLRWPWNVSAGALQLSEEQLRAVFAPIMMLAALGALVGEAAVLALNPAPEWFGLALGLHVSVLLLGAHWYRSGSPENAYLACLLLYCYLAATICLHTAVYQTSHSLLQYVPLNIASFYFMINRRVLLLAQGIGMALCIVPVLLLWSDPNLVSYSLAIVIAWFAGLAIHTGRVSILEALNRTRIALHAEIDERLEAEARSLVSKKRESLGLMAGGVAHDFNNLLTTILGGTELATNTRNDPGAEGQALTMIRDAAEAAQELCRSLLDYAGGQSGAQTRLDLNDVARDAVRLVRPRLPQHTALLAERAGDPVLVTGNAAELRQAVVNLISNALEAFKGEPGIIRVITDVLDESEPAHRRLRVLDNGPGIPQQQRERIFDPFFTTKSNGRGLGLAAVAATVEAHGGQIDVASAGSGTVFALQLPAPAVVPHEDQPGIEVQFEQPDDGALTDLSFSRSLQGSREEAQLDVLFTTIFDQLPQLVVQKDRSNTTLRVNKAMAALRGLTPEAMANSRTARWHPDEANAYFEADQEVIRSGRPMLGIREQIQVSETEKHWFLTDKVPTFDADGNVSGVLAFARRMDPLDAVAEPAQGSSGSAVETSA